MFLYLGYIGDTHNLNKMTPRRYLDWTFSTPIMLISTIVFIEISRFKEQNKDTNFKMIDFFKNNKTNIFKIFIYNGLMLLCGFLGEAGIIDKRLGIWDLYSFYLSFNLIYQEYANVNQN